MLHWNYLRSKRSFHVFKLIVLIIFLDRVLFSTLIYCSYSDKDDDSNGEDFPDIEDKSEDDDSRDEELYKEVKDKEWLQIQDILLQQFRTRSGIFAQQSYRFNSLISNSPVANDSVSNSNEFLSVQIFYVF